MIRKEAILRSPLRILDRSIRGGLGKGHLGVIMAPEGVGKSACLVQIGLDALLRQRSVLHVAVGQSVEHVSTRYEALSAFQASVAPGPVTLLVDGFDWAGPAAAETVRAIRASAVRVGAEVWLTAREGRGLGPD